MALDWRIAKQLEDMLAMASPEHRDGSLRSTLRQTINDLAEIYGKEGAFQIIVEIVREEFDDA
jgi:hypothetical protein